MPRGINRLVVVGVARLPGGVRSAFDASYAGISLADLKPLVTIGSSHWLLGFQSLIFK